MNKSYRYLINLILIMSVLFGILPFIIPEYLLSTMILFFVWAVVAQSWNLVWGIAGLWSMGQMAIFAMAGYCTGWLIIHFNLLILLSNLSILGPKQLFQQPSIHIKGTILCDPILYILSSQYILPFSK